MDGDKSEHIDDSIDSPACLANVTSNRRCGHSKRKPQNVLNVESELEIPNGKLVQKKTPSKSSPVVAPPLASKAATKIMSVQKSNQTNRSKENLCSWKNNNKKIEEYELADDATSFDGNDDDIQMSSSSPSLPGKKNMGVLVDDDNAKQMIRVQGKEELPAEQMNTSTTTKPSFKNVTKDDAQKTKINGKLSKKDNIEWLAGRRNLPKPKLLANSNDDCNGNNCPGRPNYSTLPKMRRNGQQQQQKRHDNQHERHMQIPMRTTPDGTDIYYWCDLSKKRLKGYFLHVFVVKFRVPFILFITFE